MFTYNDAVTFTAAERHSSRNPAVASSGADLSLLGCTNVAGPANQNYAP